VFLFTCLVSLHLSIAFLGQDSRLSGLGMILAMHDVLISNSVQPHVLNVSSNCTQSMPVGPGLMTDLLHSSLGDTHYLDASSTMYHSGTSLQSVPGSNFYINDRNSTYEPSHQPPHLWSPFEQHSGNSNTQNMFDMPALSQAQVSAKSNSTSLFHTDTPSTRKYSSRPQKAISSLSKTWPICTCSRRT
jgi:hypothetical protein